MREVSIFIFEGVSKKEKVLSAIKGAVKDVLSIPSNYKKELEIPGGAFNPEREQYLAKRLLRTVIKESENIGLGVTGKDIYSEGLNFVFGQASPNHNSAVLSIHRLNPSYLGESDESLFFERIKKEAVHEIGHVLGLKHCPNDRCVMHFSNNIRSVDIKGRNLCDSCKNKL